MNPFDIFLSLQQPLHWLITSLTEATRSYGLAIILFTIIIRGVLAPLYIIQMRSSKKMVELSPKIKELQRRYGKDREALTRETMALYKEHNHNPAIGCLLPLLQMPILFSLFLVLRNLANKDLQGISAHLPHYLHDAVLYKAHFLWLNLGQPDSLHILPIVAGITQWIQQRMMLQPSNDPQQRQMNQIMQFLPIMIVVFAWAYPSGLAVYWVTSNIIMMVMQYFISGFGQLFTSPFSVPMAAPTSSGSVRGTVVARDAGSGSGGFLARLFVPPAPPTDRQAPPRRGATRTTDTDTERVEEPAQANGVTSETGRAGKMERYAARHNRGAARGRPSAKGAKK